MIVFQKSGLSDLTLERGRVIPATGSIEPHQYAHLTQSNNAKVYDVGSNELEFIDIQLAGLSRDNYDGATNGLKTWFESSQINWRMNSFTMVDELGESRTVRLWQDNITYTVDGFDQYTIRFRLKVE